MSKQKQIAENINHSNCRTKFPWEEFISKTFVRQEVKNFNAATIDNHAKVNNLKIKHF